MQCESTPKCCLDLIYETVGYVNNLFKTNNITYWAMKGSLLGIHRDKGIIQHDYDIDLGTTIDQLNKVCIAIACFFLGIEVYSATRDASRFRLCFRSP